MGAAQAFAKGAKALVQLILKLLSGVSALAISTVTNTLLLGVVLVRFVVMSALRPLSSAVEFAGETTLNILAFTRDTVFSVLTFIVQTVTSSILFILNQIVAIWRLVMTIITSVLGETCFLTKTVIKRIQDFAKDISLSLKAFVQGPKGLKAVVKAQIKDVKTGVDVKTVIKQSVSAFKDTLVYIIMGDEGKPMDGIIPAVFTELFQILPLSFDLGKLILQGTYEVSKETISTSITVLKELISLKGIKIGCSGGVS